MTCRRALVLLTAVVAVGCAGSDNDVPDGKVLAFDNLNLSVISVDGGEEKSLRLKPEAWGSIDYSSDGKRIAYDADDGIYVADADGLNARRIPGQPSVHDFLNGNPSWSPGGSRLVFDHDQSLYSISPDGGEPDFLGRGSNPRWAPDGRIVFLSGVDPNRLFADVAVMNADGGGRKVLARGDYADVWPDGRTLAYSGPGGTHFAGNNQALYVMPLDGGEQRRVTDNAYAPIWSPDGGYLAFTRITECGQEACSGRIFVIPVGGGKARPVSQLIGDPGGAVAWIK